MSPSLLLRLTQDNGPFALKQVTVEGRQQTVYRYAAQTLIDIYRKAQRAAQTEFLVMDSERITITNLLRRSASYAALFETLGIKKGMRVALDLRNDADWIATFIALTSLGATAVLVHGPASSQCMAGTRCAAAVMDASVDLPIFISNDALLAARDTHQALPDTELDPEQEACIAFTSGSTGNPKGAILTHRSIVTGLMNMMLAGSVASRGNGMSGKRPSVPAVLLRTPLAHISGYMQALLMLMIGGRIVRSQASDITSLIAEHDITSIVGISDEEVAALLAVPSPDAVRPLRSIAVVGRSLPSRTRSAIRKTLPDLGLGAGYGLTETNGLICAIGNTELDMRPHAVGLVLPTVECRIQGPDGYICTAGESGQIWLRGAMLMQGYCNAPKHVMQDGWFATGDIGYQSDDGMLHLLDKEDRFLRSSGENISCREIEDAAREVSGVLEAAAMPMAGHDGGDNLLIVVAAGPKDFGRLKSTLALQFPAHIIERATFLAAAKLPRTASGKVAYAELLQEAVSG